MVTIVGLVSPEPIMASTLVCAASPTCCLPHSSPSWLAHCLDTARRYLTCPSDARPSRFPPAVRGLVNHGDMHKIDEAERRRRLAVRHALAPAHRVDGTPPDPARVARQLVALHSTDAATQAITSRVLLVLSAKGLIVRGRPIGSWLSQQYRWVLAEHWLRKGADELGAVAARTELARQWLAAFGPAPLADLKWWTGWTMADVRRAVADVGAVEVDLGGGTGAARPGDLGLTDDPGDWVALLPGLDPTVMGWSDRSWFLGEHGKALFDTNGNAGPTIWLNGRIVGGWAQRPDGAIAIKLLEDVGGDAKALIDAESERVRTWLAGVRVTPRFRTPTERELCA